MGGDVNLTEACWSFIKMLTFPINDRWSCLPGKYLFLWIVKDSKVMKDLSLSWFRWVTFRICLSLCHHQINIRASTVPDLFAKNCLDSEHHLKVTSAQKKIFHTNLKPWGYWKSFQGCSSSIEYELVKYYKVCQCHLSINFWFDFPNIFPEYINVWPPALDTIIFFINYYHRPKWCGISRVSDCWGVVRTSGW